jgi:2,3-bisphosphoglycerate-dependent phosphoglycerate mutase
VLDRLILVKHAMPAVDGRLPAVEWQLTDEGREAAKELALELKKYDPFWVVSSVEPKAWETASILAQRLRVPCAAVAGLHEHERPTPGLGTREQFHAQVRALFDRPDELVFGAETANQARARFTAAIEDALEWLMPRAEGERAQALVVVAHGTVISLLCEAWCGIDPFPFWDSLGLPSIVALSLPERRLLHRP